MDYLNQQEQSGMGFTEYYQSGQYSVFRGGGVGALSGVAAFIAVVTGGSSLPLTAKVAVAATSGMSTTVIKSKVEGKKTSGADLLSSGVGSAASMGFSEAIGDVVAKTAVQKTILAVGTVATQSDLLSEAVSEGLEAISESESAAPSGPYIETEYYMPPKPEVNREVGGCRSE
jgi:hypothetical protein